MRKICLAMWSVPLSKIILKTTEIERNESGLMKFCARHPYRVWTKSVRCGRFSHCGRLMYMYMLYAITLPIFVVPTCSVC